MTAKTMDKVASREEIAIINKGKREAKRRSREFQETLRKEYAATLDRFRETLPDRQVTQFDEKPFGGPVEEISAKTFFGKSVVSVGLFHGKVLVFACSGTAVQYWNRKIQQHHTIFVTSKRLAEEFESNRTRDDELVVRVRLHDNTTITGFLGLYDDEIAIVTVFNIAFVYPVSIRDLVDLQQDAEDSPSLFALGRTSGGGPLMGTRCSRLDFGEDAVSCDCAITEAGLGGPVILLDQDGNGHFAGVMGQVPAGEAPAKFLPTKLLSERLQRFAQAVTESAHFRGYSLPQGLHSVVPGGFMVTSLMLKSLSYPLPPPLVFELNGRLVGRFDELFGEVHVCEGFFYDVYPDGREKPLWEQLGKDVVQNLSRSVVLVSSFKGDVRCFACTGMLITGLDCKVVLTSASLFRTGDADGEIDPTLRIEVFRSREQCVEGRLDMYHQDYNIAIVSLMDDLTDVCAQDIFTAQKSSKSKVVVAIGRPTKEHEGLLLASMGNLKCRRNKNQGSEFDCKDLKLSTCKIKKVGIGGPLIRLEDGRFLGMNFYDESGQTPYLPRNNIVKVLKRGFNLLSKRVSACPIILDMDTEGNDAKKNRWPVPKPYWYLGGNRHPLDQLVRKVPM